MALKSKLNSSLNLSIHKGSVILTGWGETIGTITPEIFMEGWGKNTVDEALDGGKFDGLIPVGKSGPVGLKTRIQSSARNHKLKFELSPLSLVAVIHARVVLSLPYKDWTGAPYLLGQHCGFIPAKKSADPKISEGESKTLVLGPNHRGLQIKIKAPGLRMVLQDNRQWSAFLQAFATGHESSDKAWEWKKGEKKTYPFNLWIDHGVEAAPRKA